MSVQSVSVNQVSSLPWLRLLGWACVASGVFGVAVGVVTLAYPAAVPDTQWSYPFPTDVQWVVSVALAATHALTAAGIVGVYAASVHLGGRPVAVGLWLAGSGFGGLAIAELASGAIGGRSDTGAAADAVGGVFGVTSLLTAVGSMLAGAVILRRRAWSTVGGWMLVASGIVMVALVTPAIISGNLAATTAALMLWSLAFVPLGRAVAVPRRVAAVEVTQTRRESR